MNTDTNQPVFPGIAGFSFFSLARLQQLNEEIYGPNNSRYFDSLRMVARIGKFIGRLHKAVRFNDARAIEFHLVMAFSWSLALANKLGIPLEDEMWNRYPGVCSHCRYGPCQCDQEEADMADEGGIANRCPGSFKVFQEMFKLLYPRNTADSERGHLVEEACELLEAVDNFTATKRREWLEDSISELCDVVAHICGVANCAGIDLATSMETYYCRGCSECHDMPCTCPFPATRTPSPQKKEA